MNNLQDILYKVALVETHGSTDVSISEIVFDSRKVTDNCLFIAVKGVSVDGHQFIEKAIQSGATAIVCEDLPNELIEGISYLKVTNSAEALGILAANFFDNPSEELL